MVMNSKQVSILLQLKVQSSPQQLKEVAGQHYLGAIAWLELEEVALLWDKHTEIGVGIGDVSGEGCEWNTPHKLTVMMSARLLCGRLYSREQRMKANRYDL